MGTKPETTELSKEQLAEFGRLEKTIEKGLDTYVDVGRALIKIRDEGYYKNEFKSFDDYCLSRWGFGRRRANQIIQSSDLGKDRLNERQARALIEVPLDQRAEVLEKATDSSDGKLSAKAIKDAAEKVRAEAASASKENDEYEPIKEEAKEEDPEPIPDRFGVEIPSYVEKHFEHSVAQRFSEIMGLIQTAKKRAEALAKTEHGVHMNWDSLRAELNNAYRDVKAAKPYAVCCYCRARSSRGCKACRKQGFLGETLYKAAPKETKD